MPEERLALLGREDRRVIHDVSLFAAGEDSWFGAEEAGLLRHTVFNTGHRKRVANKRVVNVRIIAVGKVHERYVSEACAEFIKRLRPYYPVEVLEVRHAASGSVSEEGERIIRLLHQDDVVWLLDRTGTQVSSEELSAMLADISHGGTRRLTLVIGGTFGADKRLVERADFVWSLSRLTLLHEWARALVLEQIYRAAKISRNEPYHH